MINITNNDTGIVFEFQDYTNTYPYNTLGYSILDSTITIFGQEIVCTCLYSEISIDGVQIQSIDDFKNAWKGNQDSKDSITISQSFDEINAFVDLGTTSPLGCVIYDKDGNAVLITKEIKYSGYSLLEGFNDTYKVGIEQYDGAYRIIYADKTYETNSSIEVETTYYSPTDPPHFIKFTDITIQPQYTEAIGEWIGLSPKGNVMKVQIDHRQIIVSKYNPNTTWIVPKNIGAISYTTFSSSQVVRVGDFIQFNDALIQLTSSYTANGKVFYRGTNNNFTITYNTNTKYLYIALTTINTTLPLELLASTTLDGMISRTEDIILPKTINDKNGIPKATLENTCSTKQFAGGVYKDENGVRWVAWYNTLYTGELKSTSMDFTNPSVVSWSTFVNGENLMPFNGLVLLDKNDLSLELVEEDSGSTTQKLYRADYGGNPIFYVKATYDASSDYQSSVTISLK